MAKKSRFAALFSAIRSETVDYDPKVHGPLVDLSFDSKPGVEVMEMYPVNEPYAYIRVIYDHATHEYTYQVIEPVLSEPEKDLLKELKERLFETLDINTKDISKEEARISSGILSMISLPILGSSSTRSSVRRSSIICIRISWGTA